MKIFQKLFFLFVINLFFVQAVDGAKLLGTDLSYSHDSANTYTFTIKVYTECKGPKLDTISCKINGGSNYSTFTPTKVSVRDISSSCKTYKNQCDDTSSVYIGAEEHTYKQTIDFNKAPYSTWRSNGICNYMVSLKLICRTDRITTGGANTSLFASCSINLCNIVKTFKKSNSSPTKTDLSPIAINCNQAVKFNFGAIDQEDYDSLTYALIAPRISNISFIQKNPPFTIKCIPTGSACKPSPNAKPPLGFYMDPFNGDIVFTPIKCDEVGIIVVEIKEWRKDTTGKALLIGSTMREIVTTVISDTTNIPPDIKSNKYNYTVCEGDSITIKFEGLDAVVTGQNPDTVSLTWNLTIPNTTIKITDSTTREKEPTFSWQTKVGDAQDAPYSFIAEAKDGNCPYVAKASKMFSIKVLPRANGQIKIRPIRNNLEYSIELDSNFAFPANYQWQIIRTNNDTTYSFYKMDTITLKKLGESFFKINLNNAFNCPNKEFSSFDLKSDTNISPRITSLDTHITICAGEKIEFSIFAKDSSVLSVNRLDTVSLNLTDLPSRSSFYLIDSNAREKEGKFIWQTKSIDGRDSVYRFTAISIDDFSPFSDTTYQKYTIQVNPRPVAQIELTETCKDLIYYPVLSKNFKIPAKYKWKVERNNTLFDSSLLSRDSIISKLDASYKVTLFLTNKFGCKDTFKRSTNTFKSPANKGSIDLIGDCKKVNYKLQLKSTFNYPASYKWYVQDSINLVDSSTLSTDNFNYQNDSTYLITLLLKNKFNCEDSITSKIKINNGVNFPPTISSLKDHYDVCAKDSLEFDIDVKESTNLLDTITLSWNSISGSSIIKVENSAGDKSLKFKWITKDSDALDTVYKLKIMAHDNACPEQDTSYKTITIKVNKLPTTKRNFHEFCGEKGMVFLSIPDSFVKKQIIHDWAITDLNNTSLYTSSLAADTFRANNFGKYIANLKMEDGNGCKNTFTDTVNIRYIPSSIDLGKDTSILDRDSLYLSVQQNFPEYLWSTGSKDSIIKIMGKDIKPGKYLYWVAVKDTLGCIYGDTLQVIIVSTISIIEINKSNIIYYPSPTKDVLNLESPISLPNATIYLFNIIGENVMERKMDLKAGRKYSLLVSHLAKGIYLLKITNGKEEFTYKIFKE